MRHSDRIGSDVEFDTSTHHTPRRVRSTNALEEEAKAASFGIREGRSQQQTSRHGLAWGLEGSRTSVGGVWGDDEEQPSLPQQLPRPPHRLRPLQRLWDVGQHEAQTHHVEAAAGERGQRRRGGRRQAWRRLAPETHKTALVRAAFI